MIIFIAHSFLTWVRSKIAVTKKKTKSPHAVSPCFWIIPKTRTEMPDKTNEIWLKVFLFILFTILLTFLIFTNAALLKIPFYQQHFPNNKENSYQKQLFPNKNSHFLTILVYALFLKVPIW